MRLLRLVTVTNNLDRYPQHHEESEEFPHLVKQVADEVETFVFDEEYGGYWTTREFFDCTNVTHFIVDSTELP
jgi:hypothetical protein